MSESIERMEHEKRRREARMGASISLAADTAPEDLVEKKRLADILKVPLSAVEADPNTAKRMAARRIIDENTVDAPALRQMYTDPGFARLAHDQSVNLSRLERATRDFAAGFGGDFVGSSIAGIGHTMNSLQRLAMESTFNEMAATTGIELSDQEKAQVRAKADMGNAIRDVGNETKKYWQGLAPTEQTFGDQVVRGLGQAFGQLGLFAVSAPVGIVTMYGQGADQMVEKIEKDKKAQKADQALQDLETLAGGGITAVTEWAASKLMLNKIPQMVMLKNRLLNYAAKIAVGGAEEGIQETIENIGQDLAHIALTNPESKIARDEAMEAGGVGAVVGAITSAVINGALHVRARGMQQAFRKISDASADQPVRDRSPQDYHSFAEAVAAHLQNTAGSEAVKSVYIDANEFNQALVAAKIDPQMVSKEIPSIGQQMDEASITGGDIVIPIQDYIGKIAGTELSAALEPHLRSSSDAVSISEMGPVMEMSKSFEEKANEILADHEHRRAFESSANEVRKTIFDQITATGTYTPQASRLMAQLVKSFYSNAALNMGVTPAEFYQAHPYRIVGGELSGRNVTQRPKELWQLSKHEFEAAQKDQKVDIALSHEQAVQQAISEGKPVQPEVLKDYPTIVEAQKDTFVLSKNGSPDLGVIDETAANHAGIPAAAIRMQMGDETHGGIHIALAKSGGRLKKIHKYGYNSVSDFVESVAKNYNQIWGQPNGRLMLVEKNGDAKLAVVELSQDKHGDYYGVTTAFIADAGYPGRKTAGRKLLWERSTPISSGTEQTVPLTNTALETAGTQSGGVWRTGQSKDNIEPTGENVKGNEGPLYQTGNIRPVASLSGDEVGIDITADNAVELARNYYKWHLQGKSVEREGFGSVRLTGKGWKKLKRGLTTDAKKTMLIPAIPDIITKGIYHGRFDLYKERADDIIAFHFFSGLVDLQGEPLQSGVTVAEDSFGKLFYNLNHDTDALWEKLKAPLLPRLEARGAEPSENNEASPLNINISPADDDVKILFQDYKARRGGFNPETLTTILTQKADYSTFLHETAHFFLTTYAQIAADPNAAPRTKEDMQTLLDWFGVPDLASWNSMSLEEQRKHHEAFAYNFEQYLFEGRAPNVKMQSMFERFASWLKNIYVSIRDDLNTIYRQEHGEDLPILTGEVRNVMDRMLASDKQIQEAEQIRGMAPIFQTQEQSGMNDAEWAAYQEFQREACNSALAGYRSVVLRQMMWLSGARCRVLKELQGQVKDIREKIESEAADDVNAQQVYKAMRFIRTGDMADKPNGSAPMAMNAQTYGMTSTRLSLLILKDMYGDGPNATWRHLASGRNGLVANDGVHPDILADLLGYSTGDELVRAILDAKPLNEAIRELTDIRILEEHGELTDPRKIAVAVNRAIHNEARARFIAMELRHLAGTERPVGIIMEAAHQAAEAIIAKRPIVSIRPDDYSCAEARAAHEAKEAMKKEDITKAVQAKERQLLQNQLAAEAFHANAEVEHTIEFFTEIIGADPLLTNSRDMNYVQAARTILSRYGFCKSKEPAKQILQRLAVSDPDFYAEFESMFSVNHDDAVPFDRLTREALRDLNNKVRVLWHQSIRTMQIEIEGRLIETSEAVSELTEAMKHLDVPSIRHDYDRDKKTWERTEIGLLGLRAAMHCVEHWINAMDRVEASEPFRRYIWTPVNEAVSKYRSAKRDYLMEFFNLLEGKNHLLEGKEISAYEIDHTFKPNELFHALLHTGNQSNLRKLLTGYGWGKIDERGMLDTSNWDSFIRRCWVEGVIGKDHYDLCQALWDLMEEMTPQARKTYCEIYGVDFAVSTCRPFDSPWGSYAGGYVPAVAAVGVTLESTGKRQNRIGQSTNISLFPEASKGRGAYDQSERPLLLNVFTLATHIDRVLRFSFLESAVRDVCRIIRNSKFAESVDLFDPSVRENMLIPWLQRAAVQLISIPAKGLGGKTVHAVYTYLRNTAFLQMTVGNMAEILKQVSGLSLALPKLRPAAMRDALWLYVRQPRETAGMILVRSDFMKTRLDSELKKLQKLTDEMILSPSKYSGLKLFADRNGYILEAAVRSVVDTITWAAAYNQVVTDGVAVESEAVRQADELVKLMNGAKSTVNSENVETESPCASLILQACSYFNMQAKLLGDKFLNTARKLCVKEGAGRMLYLCAFGYMIPAVLMKIIIQRTEGFDTGKDDDVESSDAMRLFFSLKDGPLISDVHRACGVIQFDRELLQAKPNNESISSAPAISIIESTVRAPYKIYEAIADEGPWGKAESDFLTGLGMITWLHVGKIGGPAGYELDVGRGLVEAKNRRDMASRLVSG